MLQKGKVINQRIAEAAEFSNSSISDIDMAELAIDRAEAALKAAENYIDTEGRKALQRAREALDRFGQQSEQMTLIAQKATLESERSVSKCGPVFLVPFNTHVRAYHVISIITGGEKSRMSNEIHPPSILSSNAKFVTTN